jgi:hypothetical protein
MPYFDIGLQIFIGKIHQAATIRELEVFMEGPGTWSHEVGRKFIQFGCIPPFFGIKQLKKW